MLRVAHDRGVGLRVGRGSTEARHRLRDSNSVRRFLRGLAERVGGRPANPRFARRLKTAVQKISAAGAASKPVGPKRRRGP
jgi:hypothetical protein